ncbi:ComEC/Rec2 family competence protein [Mycoplasma suis]|nr:ComEC/Rec2 family competence protein [Mycoplasma suis]
MYSSNYIGSAIKADKFLFFLQEKLNKVIVSNYSGKTQKFISYLLLNKRDREINPVIEDFRELSIVHLIVISGFHMNLVKNILSKIIPNCLNPKIKKILIFSSLFTYSWATAFSIPSTRIFFEESSELFKEKRIRRGNLFHLKSDLNLFGSLFYYSLQPFPPFLLFFLIFLHLSLG